MTCGSALSQLWRPVDETRGSRAFRGQRGVGGKVAAALVSAEERRPEAARRERFAVGRVRGRDFGSDRPKAGPDLGRNGCRTAQATDQNQPQLALAFSRPTQHHAQKKCCKQPNGSEQMWRERAAAGYESKVLLILPGWCLSTRPPSARNGAAQGARPRGVRLIGAVPLGRWETITFVAALRHNKMIAPMVVEGAMTGEMFLAYVEKCLVPTLKRNDIVVMDNSGSIMGPALTRRSKSRRDSALPAEVFARPQSHRDAIQQIQGIAA